MSEEDRAGLDRILNAYKTLSDLLREGIRNRPNDPALLEARRQLASSFQLRLYAVFESILARRARGSGIASYVQSEVGVAETLDPAPPHDRIEWWRLLQRDRNHLAHGNPGSPSLSLPNTVRLFESYLAMRTERVP